MYKTGKYILYKEHMNLRNAPKANAEIVAVLPHGALIEVDEVINNWGRIIYENKTGWCCISECFAKPVCTCEMSECCYFDRYNEIKKEYDILRSNIEKIKSFLK
jgi:hypothetical protein